MTHYCRLCGDPLTRHVERLAGETLAWWYCEAHPNADQEARSVPVKVEGH